ncbi:MAG TPA: 3-dehydroquinate synthase [Firmicutes bacterium]|nr:3-dehydroquinate synthase [Bacillota bacterium]
MSELVMHGNQAGGQAARNIALVGFMGAGKSTVGQMLAAQGGLTFLDIDTLIEKEAGLSIPAIFETRGEAYFRRLESRLTQEAAAGEGLVIATGGGAVTDPATLEALKKNCFVVWLHAGLELLLARTGHTPGTRPLLAGKKEQIEELWRRRLPLYAVAHLVVDAAAPAAEIAGRLLRLWRGTERFGPLAVAGVALGARSYQITVGTGLLADIDRYIPGHKGKALVVGDSNTWPLYGEQVFLALARAGWECRQCVFPAGERSKNLEVLAGLYKACAQARLERSSVVIAVGGGVTGDLAGLAAATYLRGVRFVQVPTTLLAQVDAAVGGKVAIDLEEGKNLVGAFYQPAAVVADMAALSSLPSRQLLSGLAEVIKHGLIADAPLFAFLEEELPAVLSYHSAALARCVLDSCRIKSAVVEEDETEAKGRRELLNFGHTVAHAVETVTGYSRYTHGEAVAIGMVTATHLSVNRGLPAGVLERLLNLLKRAGLPVAAPDLPIEAVVAAAGRDKKVKDGQLRLVLLTALGRAQAGVPVSPEELAQALSWQAGL